MPIEILMPALSPTMTEGNLAKWLKAEGDSVAAGDLIAEIETDKATMEVEAVDEGVFGRILVPEGTEGVAVNTPIALLLADGENASALDAYAAGPAPAQPPTPLPAPEADTPMTTSAVKATPLAARMAAQAGLDLTALPASAPGGKVGKADVLAALGRGESPTTPTAAPAAPASSAGAWVFASPLARAMARQAGIDLATVTGSGPGGRIVKADMEAAMALPPAAPAVAAPTEIAAPPAAGHTDIPHSNVRKIIAKRLTEAARDIPHIYLTIDCEIDRLLAARKEINAASPEGEGAWKVSVNDMIIKASALALRRVPEVNAMWTETAIRLLDSIDISVAVAYEGGLITPIIFAADGKGLAQISGEMKALAARARAGKLKPEEFQGGGFSVSNLGMFGIRQFTSIINPPQACILAVGAGAQRPIVRDGKLDIATMMSVTLSCDHRVVDGALGARWLQAFQGFIEAPATMLA